MRRSKIAGQIADYQRRQISERCTKNRFSRSKRIATKNNTPWKIPFAQYEKIISLPCNYCGSRFTGSGIGLDRIDSSLGYLKTNVVSCCGVCNSMKSNFHLELFLSRIESIYKNTFKK